MYNLGWSFRKASRLLPGSSLAALMRFLSSTLFLYSGLCRYTSDNFSAPGTPMAESVNSSVHSGSAAAPNYCILDWVWHTWRCRFLWGLWTVFALLVPVWAARQAEVPPTHIDRTQPHALTRAGLRCTLLGASMLPG